MLCPRSVIDKYTQPRWIGNLSTCWRFRSSRTSLSNGRQSTFRGWSDYMLLGIHATEISLAWSDACRLNDNHTKGTNASATPLCHQPSPSDHSKCNRDVADKWISCVQDCRGDGNCIVECGCDSHLVQAKLGGKKIIHSYEFPPGPLCDKNIGV